MAKDGGTDAAPLARPLHERTDGNPLFVTSMVDYLAADHSGKILGVSSRGVREIKMLQTAGFSPGRPYTAQEVAEHASEVFFADAEARTAVSA